MAAAFDSFQLDIDTEKTKLSAVPRRSPWPK